MNIIKTAVISLFAVASFASTSFTGNVDTADANNEWKITPTGNCTPAWKIF